MLEFFEIAEVELLLRLLCAMLIGGLIGLERGGRNHDAGLKTHILVCLGSASIMALSGLIYEDVGRTGDVTRMAAQVISGIGFLGAGSIIIGGNKIKGLTTAATLWTTACLGLVVGSGYYLLALYTTALMMFTMYCLRPLATKIQESHQSMGIAVNVASKKSLAELSNYLNEQGIDVKSISLNEGSHDGDISVIISVKAEKKKLANIILMSLCSIDGVNDASILD
ncbi:MAG: MgtC/SapB family protein [Clostridia bacterium]|nr:MgtC/SapB family protein [Clostridia bacterium]